MNQWKTIFNGTVRMLPVKIEQGDDGILRVRATVQGLPKEIEVKGETVGQLEENLIAYGAFTGQQVREIIHKILHK